MTNILLSERKQRQLTAVNHIVISRCLADWIRIVKGLGLSRLLRLGKSNVHPFALIFQAQL